MNTSRIPLLLPFVGSDDNLPQIRELLDRGEDPNFQGYGGYTICHAAIESAGENIAVLQELINAGADVNLADHLGFTPLQYAVLNTNLSAVNALIQHGALINAKNFMGETALHYAVEGWTFSIEGTTCIHVPHPWIVKKLLQHEDVDYNARNSKGNTPLMWAIEDEQMGTPLILLRKGVNPNICNISENALHIAFAKRPVYTEILLLLKGACIYALDKHGRTPIDILMKSLKDGNRSIAWGKLLLKIIALKYHIREDLVCKLECVSELWLFLIKCRDEVNRMRTDTVAGDFTIHDFILDCFQELHFKNALMQIYKPVVDRLVASFYPEYHWEILHRVSKSDLSAILEITVNSKKNSKRSNEVELAGLLSKFDVICLLSSYLSREDIFCLIVAFSGVKIAHTMRNLRDKLFETSSDFGTYITFFMN